MTALVLPISVEQLAGTLQTYCTSFGVWIYGNLKVSPCWKQVVSMICLLLCMYISNLYVVFFCLFYFVLSFVASWPGHSCKRDLILRSFILVKERLFTLTNLSLSHGYRQRALFFNIWWAKPIFIGQTFLLEEKTQMSHKDSGCSGLLYLGRQLLAALLCRNDLMGDCQIK